MEIREVLKSQLLKNVTIEEKNKCSGLSKLSDNDKPILVEEINGEYFIQEGLERVLNAHKNLAGDDKIRCNVILGANK